MSQSFCHFDLNIVLLSLFTKTISWKDFEGPLVIEKKAKTVVNLSMQESFRK